MEKGMTKLILISIIISQVFLTVNSQQCSQINKQKSLYGEPKYSPDLRYNFVKEAFTTVKATLIEPLREHNKNGIYEATMMYTTQKDGRPGASGYFGVQWKGLSFQKDMLLFSIWDKKSGSTVTSYALPNHLNCKRNCNDCAVHGQLEGTTGTKCYFNLPQKLQEGDELKLKVEREPVENLEFDQGQYMGHVWTVKVNYVSGPNKENFMVDQFDLDGDEDFVLGRILFSEDNLAVGEESTGGINRFSMFHEHLGCTPCNSFAFEVDRFGPYITKAIDNENLPELVEGDATFSCAWNTLGNCTCRSFDVKSYQFGGFTFQTGPGYLPHWEDLRSKSRMYWTEGDEQHAKDGDCFSDNTFYRGSRVSGKHKIKNVNSALDCQTACQEHQECNFFTWNSGSGAGRWNKKNKNTCWLKSETGKVKENCGRRCNGQISGPKSC